MKEFKNAEEMFEKLNYKIKTNNEDVLTYFSKYYNDESDYTQEMSISFYKKLKYYNITFCDGFNVYEYNTPNVSKLLHQAITKQMQELGWI